MSNYTDVECGNRHVAETVKAYLESELASIEEIERPNITAIIEKSTLRVTYHADDCHRGDWDMQLLGYRDGLETALPPPRAKSERQLACVSFGAVKGEGKCSNGCVFPEPSKGEQGQLDRIWVDNRAFVLSCVPSYSKESDGAWYVREGSGVTQQSVESVWNEAIRVAKDYITMNCTDFEAKYNVTDREHLWEVLESTKAKSLAAQNKDQEKS